MLSLGLQSFTIAHSPTRRGVWFGDGSGAWYSLHRVRSAVALAAFSRPTELAFATAAARPIALWMKISE